MVPGAGRGGIRPALSHPADLHDERVPPGCPARAPLSARPRRWLPDRPGPHRDHRLLRGGGARLRGGPEGPARLVGRERPDRARAEPGRVPGPGLRVPSLLRPAGRDDPSARAPMEWKAAPPTFLFCTTEDSAIVRGMTDLY